jgi:large subunit ribosomal protein L23
MKNYENTIIRPYITEKTTIEAGKGKYTFVVSNKATKVDIRKAVEMLFNVKVISVNVQNYEGKEKRQGVHVGMTPDWKKAIVKIDTEPAPKTYYVKGGKQAQDNKKYNNSIEEFGNLQ